MKRGTFFSLGGGCLAGIAYGTWASVSYAGIAFVCMLGALMLLRTWRSDTGSGRFLLCAGIALLAFGAGMFRAESVTQRFVDNIRSIDVVEHQGVVVSDPERSVFAEQVDVYDEASDMYVRAQLPLGSGLRVGDRIRYSATLEEAEPFASEYGRVFDYARFLRARDISALAKKVSFENVGEDEWYVHLRKLYDVKYAVAASIARAMPEPEAGFAQAMLLGIRRTLDESENRVFTNVGIVHIVVLSGYHLMTIYALVVILVSGLVGYRARYLLAGVSVILFAAMVGFTPTVSRAVVMALCLMSAAMLSRSTSPMRSVTIAAVLLAWWAPYGLLYDPGFQFSFLATIGIVVVGPIFEDMLARIPSTFGVRSIVAMTLATECTVVPLVAFLMGQFPLVGVLANLLVLFVVPYAMLAALGVAAAAYLLPVLVPSAAFIATQLHAYILGVAHLLAKVPYAHVAVPPFSFGMLCAVYAGIALLVTAAWYRFGGMPQVRESAYSGVDVSGWTIEDLDVVRARVA